MRKKEMYGKFIVLSNLYRCFLIFAFIGAGVYFYEQISQRVGAETDRYWSTAALYQQVPNITFSLFLVIAMVIFQPKSDSSKLVEIQELLDETLQTELSANMDEEDLALDHLEPQMNQKTI